MTLKPDVHTMLDNFDYHDMTLLLCTLTGNCISTQ